MAQPDDIEGRMAAQEARVDNLSTGVRRSREDAAAARILAGAADRDVAEIRGEVRDLRNSNNASFNAMREDLTDLRQEVTDFRQEVTDLRQEMNNRFAEVNGKVDEGFAQVDRNFTRLRGVLDGQAAGQEQITNLLTTMIEKQGDQ